MYFQKNSPTVISFQFVICDVYVVTSKNNHLVTVFIGKSKHVLAFFLSFLHIVMFTAVEIIPHGSQEPTFLYEIANTMPVDFFQRPSGTVRSNVLEVGGWSPFRTKPNILRISIVSGCQHTVLHSICVSI